MNEKYKGYKNKKARKEYNRDYQREYMKKYRAKLKAEGRIYKWNSPEYLKNLRIQAIDKLGGPHCSGCGCDVYAILEINHINGDGNLERKKLNHAQFLRNIIKGKVDITQYNVLCKICNIQHYVQVILNIAGHTITWQ